jgi:hypothetical protein
MRASELRTSISGLIALGCESHFQSACKEREGVRAMRIIGDVPASNRCVLQLVLFVRLPFN